MYVGDLVSSSCVALLLVSLVLWVLLFAVRSGSCLSVFIYIGSLYIQAESPIPTDARRGASDTDSVRALKPHSKTPDPRTAV